MIANDSDRTWQIEGNENPYFGVLSDPKFLDANLNDESLKEFFDSGSKHVEHIYRVIESSIRQGFQSNRVLDFGCGVGRLVVPFAQRSQEVVGVDVSLGMLRHARENCQKFAAGAARLLHVDELDSLPTCSFDLIHSYIVFQHIPVHRGELIFRKLIGLIAEGGIGAIHFTYSDSRTALQRAVTGLRLRFSLVHGLLNLSRGKRFSSPINQMNSYSINRIFDILLELNCSNVFVEFSAHGPIHGTMIYFVKESAPLL